MFSVCLLMGGGGTCSSKFCHQMSYCPSRGGTCSSTFCHQMSYCPGWGGHEFWTSGVLWGVPSSGVLNFWSSWVGGGPTSGVLNFWSSWGGGGSQVLEFWTSGVLNFWSSGGSQGLDFYQGLGVFWLLCAGSTPLAVTQEDCLVYYGIAGC